MQTTSVDKLYGTDVVVKWVKDNYLEEEIIFASAATILETKESNPTGWSLRRLFQRRGVFVITQNQLVVKTLFSFITVFYLLAIIYLLSIMISSIILYSNISWWPSLFGVIFLSILTASSLPYQKIISLTEIQKTESGYVRGITGTFSLFTIYLQDLTINIVPAQALSEDIMNIISSSTK